MSGFTQTKVLSGKEKHSSLFLASCCCFPLRLLSCQLPTSPPRWPAVSAGLPAVCNNRTINTLSATIWLWVFCLQKYIYEYFICNNIILSILSVTCVQYFRNHSYLSATCAQCHQQNGKYFNQYLCMGWRYFRIIHSSSDLLGRGSSSSFSSSSSVSPNPTSSADNKIETESSMILFWLGSDHHGRCLVGWMKFFFSVLKTGIYFLYDVLEHNHFWFLHHIHLTFFPCPAKFSCGCWDGCRHHSSICCCCGWWRRRWLRRNHWESERRIFWVGHHHSKTSLPLS